MSEGLQSVLDAAPWAPLAVAFLVGLGCGFLIWGLRSGDSEFAGTEAIASAPVEGDERKEIVILRAELEAARALLDEGDDQQEEVGRQLSALDEALKRANGRLKVLLRSVKR
jgi:hypothetical protein